MTAEAFYDEREKFLKEVAEEFNCDVIDLGCGFPQYRDTLFFTPPNIPEPGSEDDPAKGTRACDLHNFTRIQMVRQMETTSIRRLLNGSSRQGKVVWPLGMPFHDTSNYSTPREAHIGRSTIAVVNAMNAVAQFWMGIDKQNGLRPYAFCPGIPRLVISYFVYCYSRHLTKFLLVDIFFGQSHYSALIFSNTTLVPNLFQQFIGFPT